MLAGPLDVHDETWPVAGVDAVVCINMIHIAPPSATEALLHGAASILRPGGVLFLYGPYRRDGRQGREFNGGHRPTYFRNDSIVCRAAAIGSGSGSTSADK